MQQRKQLKNCSLTMIKKYKIIPIFVPHIGCPHQCSFCNQKHITGQLTDMTLEKAKQIIETYLSTIDSNKHNVEIAFFGGSFTAIDINMQNQFMDLANEYIKKGAVHGIRLSTRPDCVSDEILQNLKAKNVTEIELGAQSMCNDVLKLNNRGHISQDVKDAAERVKGYGFTLGLQMMVGLFGDSMDKSIYTAKEIAKLKPDFVRIYPTLVFKNTELAELYESGEYVPLSLVEATKTCGELLNIFGSENIKVIRVGLLLSDDEAKNNFIAGPYHPRFKELVISQ